MTRFLARELSTAHWYNLDAARRDLGYSPQVGIEEGLQAARRIDAPGRRLELFAVAWLSPVGQDLSRRVSQCRQDESCPTGSPNEPVPAG